MEQEIQLNAHNKQEYPPMHTAEHLLNSQMVKYFHCKRSFSAHIERKKSKCDYHLGAAPTAEDIAAVEQAVNDIIEQKVNVEEIFYPVDQVPESINLTRLPEPGIKTIRVIRIGNHDQCACIGQHVANTAEIGTFRVISFDFNDGTLRIRFKLVDN